MAACASATTGEEVEQIKLIVIFHGLVPVSIFWRAICFKDESAWQASVHILLWEMSLVLPQLRKKKTN